MIIARDSIIGMKQARTLADKAVGRIRSDFPEWEVEATVIPGSPSESIIVKADEWGADLLVVGSHGHTMLGSFFLGSVSQTVVAHAHCSARVARIRPHKQTVDPDSPVRIIIGVDGSPGAETAVRAVTSRQWPQGSEARVVNGSWSMPPVREDMETHENIARQLAEWSARERRVAEEIIDSAVEQLKAAGLVTTAVFKEEEPKRDAEAIRCVVIGGMMQSEFFRSVASAIAVISP
jgi:nucleotide-binding universal stress UspA family protein